MEEAGSGRRQAREVCGGVAIIGKNSGEGAHGSMEFMQRIALRASFVYRSFVLLCAFLGHAGFERGFLGLIESNERGADRLGEFAEGGGDDLFLLIREKPWNGCLADALQIAAAEFLGAGVQVDQVVRDVGAESLGHADSRQWTTPPPRARKMGNEWIP